MAFFIRVIANKEIVTCSPVEIRASNSLPEISEFIDLAKFKSLLVSPLIAETTTTKLLPLFFSEITYDIILN